MTGAPHLVRVGLVSDTHGLFDPRLRDVFSGCSLILHAGDVVRRTVLEELRRIAPVRAVRGNNDLGPEFEDLPEIAVVGLGGVTAVLVHQVGAAQRPYPEVRRALSTHRASLLVFGHSHRPLASCRDGLLHVNPGSAGPRRFRLPRSAGLLDVHGTAVEVRLVDLASPGLSLLEPALRCDLASLGGAAPR
jgi:putative phosphoesterase